MTTPDSSTVTMSKVEYDQLMAQWSHPATMSVAASTVVNLKGRRTLYTCAIRSAAIYGPGEERHLPRILSLVKSGLFRFKIGEETVRTDWVYVDNLVLALILASMGLLDDLPGKKGNPIASGQPYFISDAFMLMHSSSTAPSIRY
ncbi:3 beta-hydroxysteroid dehydrogenase/Delta 5--_4-isomerase [Nymphaea thermarum]|nr:3 beta-hydroxysteroid dehydrogenase/Delta 5-->4-isomerase [Nymphaea thermarum]